MSMTDFFHAEPLIVERIKAKLPAIKQVSTHVDLQAAKDQQVMLPNATVMYAGYRIHDAKGVSTSFAQRWMVVVSVPNINDQTGDRARDVAGPILAELTRIMIGWKPAQTLSQFKAEPSPPPSYRPGIASFPIVFSTNIVQIGAPHD